MDALGRSGVAFGALALAACLGAAIAGTWPVAARLGAELPGAGGDAYHHAWNLWYVHQALARGDQGLGFTTILYHPEGTSLLFNTTNVGGGLLALPLLRMGATPSTAHGVVWLSTFVLSGLSGAFLGLRATGDRFGALVAGLAFQLCPYRMAHGTGHLDLLGTCFMPVTAACLLSAWDAATPRRRLAEGLVAGAAWGITGLWSWSYFVFVGMFLCLGAVLLALLRRERMPASGLLACLLVAGLMVAPLAAPMILEVARGDDSYYLDSADAFPADVAGYLLPSSLHPWLGPVSRWLTGGRGVFSGNVPEGTVTLGLTVTVLAAAGFRRAPRLFPVALVAFLALSLGTRVTVAGTTLAVAGPYALLEHLPILRGLRIPARFSVMVALCAIPLVAAGAARLRARLGRTGAGACVVVMLLELQAVGYPTAPGRIPDSYRDMARDTTPGAVLDLPHVHRRRDMYLHTAHGRPVAGGFTARVDRTARQALNRRLAAIIEPLTAAGEPPAGAVARALAEMGIRFVILDDAAAAARPSGRLLAARLGAAFPGGPWRRGDGITVFRVDPPRPSPPP